MKGDKMEKFCFVVERIEWDDDLGSDEYWEDRCICRVCKFHEDAKAFVEGNSAEVPYPMQWLGDRKYSGRSVTDGRHEEGLIYILHYVAMF